MDAMLCCVPAGSQKSEARRVNADFEVAQLHRLKLQVARTQILLVLRLVGYAAARVGGDDVICFILIHGRCAVLHGRLCPLPDLFQAKLAIVLLDNPVALAGGVFKFLAVHDLHCATGVLDELLLLQDTSRHAHAGPIPSLG